MAAHSRLADGAPEPADRPAASGEWAQSAAAVLRRSGVSGDVDARAALTTHTDDEIAVLPLYTAADAAPVAAQPWPGERAGWDVRVRYRSGDPASVNASARAQLDSGADSLWLVFGDDGLAADAMPDLLDGIDLARTPVALDRAVGGASGAGGASVHDAAFALLGVAERRGVARADLAGSLGADPIGARARGGPPADLSALLALAEQSKGARDLAVSTVDATIYHDAGATDAQEIAIATAVGVAYLRALCDGGLDVDDALAAIEFRFAVGAGQFDGIAKLRAARRVWARVAQRSGACAGRRVQRQHAVTSAAMLTRRDPWVNMLRTTLACFAASVGGADTITVAPFDEAIGRPDEFGRRIARNTSAILHDEASLARVADAGAGSWYLESLTDALARRAWGVFTGIERPADGGAGALALLESGRLADMLRDPRDRRAGDVAHRRTPITGVSVFARLDEEPVQRPPEPEPAGGLPRGRRAAPYEALRDRADRWRQANAAAPSVFLAALGDYAQHSAATGFAAGLFAAGGIDTRVGSAASDELVEQWRASGSAVACLCSSEDGYAGEAGAEAAALKAAGVRLLWLVGEPGTRLGPDLSAGVDGYLYPGCDALDALARTLDAIAGAA